MTKRLRPDQFPPWYDGQSINEAAFCREFLASHKLLYTENSFFTPEGRMTDVAPLKTEIYQIIEPYASTSVPKKISNIIELLKITAHIDDFPPRTDRIHVANGTLFLDGSYSASNDEIVRSRFPVAYNPSAPSPETWLGFLHGLLYEDDIPALQEYIGYCLIPSNKGQRMMVIKGRGGEGKSQIGVVLSKLFGTNMKDGSIGKISENRFARADLEHILLCVDDDMRMEALRQTNYVKSIVTALYDRSDGFYRRQLVLTTRDKPADRVDDPDIAEKMAAEAEGIFLWAFEGLQRLVRNGFKFTESDRARQNRELVKRDNNNFFDFMEAEDYIRLKADACISSKDLYTIYKMWCEENNLVALKARSFSDAVIANLKKYNLEHTNNIANSAGRRVWGYLGIEALVRPEMPTSLWG